MHALSPHLSGGGGEGVGGFSTDRARPLAAPEGGEVNILEVGLMASWPCAAALTICTVSAMSTMPFYRRGYLLGMPWHEPPPNSPPHRLYCHIQHAVVFDGLAMCALGLKSCADES